MKQFAVGVMVGVVMAMYARSAAEVVLGLLVQDVAEE